MKKLIALLALCLFLAGCGRSKIVRIPSESYLETVRAIYDKPEDYLDKTIVIQGLFTYLENEDSHFAMVYRFDGDDNPVGFEVVYGGAYPQNFSWVEAEGTLDSYESDGDVFLRILVSRIKVITGGDIEADK